MNKEKSLILFRGLCGAGKTTLANLACDVVYEADDYFMKSGEYVFDRTKLGDAHLSCKKSVEDALFNNVARVGVANTFTVKGEINPYIQLGEYYGYKVYVVIVENRRGASEDCNVHDVPVEAISRMRERFEVELG